MPLGLYEYWLQKHRDGRPPSRKDLDPLFEIPVLLPNLYLLDLIGDAFRFRLVGSEIVTRAGRDSTGRLIDEAILGDQALASWLRILRKARDQQVPILYCFTSVGMTKYDALAIVVPLVDASGKTEMLMGWLSYGKGRDVAPPQVPDRVYEIGLPESRTISDVLLALKSSERIPKM